MYKFLGLNMKPGRKYTNTIEKPFFISGIAIGEGENAELYVTHEKKTFLAAKVSKVIPQVPLDLYFSRDDKIVFKIKGDAMVSLVGHWYHTDSDEFDERSANKNKNGKKAFAQAEDDEEDDEDDDDDDGEEEEDEEEDDDDSRLIEKESFQENGEEDDEEDSDSDDEEEVAQPKAKVAKLSPEIIVKKGA